MGIVVITGSCGLIGSEAAKFYHEQGYEVYGIDNNLRKHFFGTDACTQWKQKELTSQLKNYKHIEVDIRNKESIDKIFSELGGNISCIIHTAAQPSHDWAASDPIMDFTVNANGTLNLLEATRNYAPKASFIFTSTNKVYGDRPNHLGLVESETRYELKTDHAYSEHGIDESMSIDQCLHSLFGASKVAADVLTQEYGRYFNLNTGVFRGGCLTGPAHSGAKLHGFLSYIVKCAINDTPYTVFGYKGKQVRDNIHSYDLVQAFWHFSQNPRQGEVYNIGGSRHSNCSVLEVLNLLEQKLNKKIDYSISDESRIGDHMWWISDVRKFQSHYPNWKYEYNLENIVDEIINHFKGI